MKLNKIGILILLIITISGKSYTQDSTQNRLKPLLIASSATYVTSLVLLDQLWYSDFERKGFHFFNDNREWKQVDKVGHFYSAFHISNASYKLLRWAYMDEDKSIFWGSIASVIALTPIEIFDGFSSEYGASYGDLIANTAGGLFFYGQQKTWGEIRVHPKYSFSQSPYAELRPETLGKNLSEELLKDYNAQTFWLSFDLSKFNAKLPKWLNIAMGYGANDMIFANDDSNKSAGFNPQRQFYIGLDLDLNEYKTRSKALNTLIYFVNMVKIPGPTLELRNGKFYFHSFYY
ncbi:DUF2279 domain-containing protein [Fulvivirga lutea]|uniref:DUF2279 domain-containing protein n=1 Tax=Fulvivirga lutea TaxID=2810512 RepID=A0A974WKQ8_9BACT|nr:DUF2279 domain-containing protein [Fulvivirga lutea]QSE97158.1 DUF2279 domain-containing protein [Fulvivirga lutea]